MATAKKMTRVTKAISKRLTSPKDPTKLKGVLEGQKGPTIDLPYDGLNEKERSVLRVFNPIGPRGAVRIEELARYSFPALFVKDSGRANSWVRNSLRRLVRGNWIETAGASERGKFRLTIRAKTFLAKIHAAPKKHSAKVHHSEPVAAAS